MAAGFKGGEKETNSYGVNQAQVLGSYKLTMILKYGYYRSRHCRFSPQYLFFIPPPSWSSWNFQEAD